MERGGIYPHCVLQRTMLLALFPFIPTRIALTSVGYGLIPKEIMKPLYLEWWWVGGSRSILCSSEVQIFDQSSMENKKIIKKNLHFIAIHFH